MSAALPPMVKHAIAVGHMSKGRVVKGIEQTWCRASKSARGDGKFADMRQLLSSTPVLGIALQPLYLYLISIRHISLQFRLKQIILLTNQCELYVLPL